VTPRDNVSDDLNTYIFRVNEMEKLEAGRSSEMMVSYPSSSSSITQKTST